MKNQQLQNEIEALELVQKNQEKELGRLTGNSEANGKIKALNDQLKSCKEKNKDLEKRIQIESASYQKQHNHLLDLQEKYQKLKKDKLRWKKAIAEKLPEPPPEDAEEDNKKSEEEVLQASLNSLQKRLKLEKAAAAKSLDAARAEVVDYQLKVKEAEQENKLNTAKLADLKKMMRHNQLKPLEEVEIASVGKGSNSVAGETETHGGASLEKPVAVMISDQKKEKEKEENRVEQVAEAQREAKSKPEPEGKRKEETKAESKSKLEPEPTHAPEHKVKAKPAEEVLPPEPAPKSNPQATPTPAPKPEEKKPSLPKAADKAPPADDKHAATTVTQDPAPIKKAVPETKKEEPTPEPENDNSLAEATETDPKVTKAAHQAHPIAAAMAGKLAGGNAAGKDAKRKW